MRDWTASEEVQGTGDTRRVNRVLLGAYWGGAARGTRASSRVWNEPAHVSGFSGFRLPRSVCGLVTIHREVVGLRWRWSYEYP